MSNTNPYESKYPRVLVLDFGAHSAQAIARIVRDCHVFSEVVPFDITPGELKKMKPAAIILSGGDADKDPASMIFFHTSILEFSTPILDLRDAKDGTPVEINEDVISFFLYHTVGLKPEWTIDTMIFETVKAIRERVGDDKVICALSGGVDSSVVAALLHRAIGDQLTCVFVNHGLLRKGEPEQVIEVFRDQYDINLVYVDAEDRYLKLLDGVTDPEEKRRIIGETFWNIFFEEAEKLDGIKWLAQGTIYPDVIESGSKTAAKVKSHHNLIPFPEGVFFKLIEPLEFFFKDEVRAIGAALGLPESVVKRQPFPGPGLGVRVIGAINKEKLDILREADAIVREEITNWDTEGSVWQFFAALLDIRSTGVRDGERCYERPVVIRAINSVDAMTADWAKLPYELLDKMSRRIVTEVEGVNRVAYDITSKPPGTIEWE